MTMWWWRVQQKQQQHCSSISSRIVGLFVLFTIFATVADAFFFDAREVFCGRKQTCYEVLGVDQLVDFKTVKKTYRRLSLKYHPDKNDTKEAVEKFRQIVAAYEILSDPKKRRAYDKYLENPDSLMAAYEGIRAVYPARSNPLIVLVGMLVLISLVQYINQEWSYTSGRQGVVRTQKFQKLLEEELGYRVEEYLEERRGSVSDNNTNTTNSSSSSSTTSTSAATDPGQGQKATPTN
eukprot:Filipodium_phascolosomae@DN8310_c0_g1_i1.p1